MIELSAERLVACYFAGAGAALSNFGTVASMQAQLGADLAQIVAIGLPSSGSSNVPTRAMIRSGRVSDSLKTGVPQSGQKLRCITEPLSAIEV
jgi:hypothetical protein